MATLSTSPLVSPTRDHQALSAEPQGSRRLTRTIAVVALASSLGYLTWRLAATLNPEAWVVSWLLFALEFHAVVGLALFTFSLWDLDAGPRVRPEAAGARRVAVLIPTYDEPVEVLLPTIAAAVALKPAHETWVLDDGARPEVRKLAAELGARYLARTDRTDAKAGNLNHALAVVDTDLVAVLDADHVAAPEFLTRTLGYFADPGTALVQTPQDFYNTTSFEHVETRGLRRHTRALLNEQSLFYRAIQPGKNRWGAAFWCGTGAVLRVAALRDVGGVATGTITEDIQTTIRLHRAGWSTVYHNEVLARGLAASSAHQYALQRMRWCTGAMQVLRRERPLTAPGLTLAQRVAYAATLLGWFDAWRSLGYVLLPLAVLTSGASPIRASWPLFLAAFGITSTLQQVALWRLGRGQARPLVAIVFDFVRMAPTLRATLTVLGSSRPVFRVTPKGRTGQRRRRPPAPRLLTALLAASMLTAGWYGATLAGLTPLGYTTPWVAHAAAFWLMVNAALLVAAVHRVRSLRFAAERRDAVRFPAAVPGVLDGRLCAVEDLSLTGARLAVAADQPLAADDEARHVLELGLPEGPRRFTVVVRSVASGPDGVRHLGVGFVDLSRRRQAALALALFSTGPAASRAWTEHATAA